MEVYLWRATLALLGTLPPTLDIIFSFPLLSFLPTPPDIAGPSICVVPIIYGSTEHIMGISKTK